MNWKEAEAKYGAIIAGVWKDEAKHMITIDIPKEISAVCMNSATKKPFTRLYCNRDLAEKLITLFSILIAKDLHKELKTFDGCFQIRTTRGAATPSAHSWGIAIDFNAKENPLGGPVKFSQPLLEEFRQIGFTCGADFRRLDGMHFSLGF